MRLAALSLLALLACPAIAEDGRSGQEEDPAGRFADPAEAELAMLVLVQAVAAYCPGYGIGHADHARLDQAVENLSRGVPGLSEEDFETRFLEPALAALDRPKTCDTVGPKIADLLRHLPESGAAAVIAAQGSGG